MKILFYYRVNKENSANQGVIKKCHSQATALRNLGHEVDEICLGAAGILKNDQLLYTFAFPVLSRLWTTYLFYFFQLLRQVSRKTDFSQYDLLLIRYPMSHPLMDAFLQKAKRENPKLQIILEFPTYPYDQEPIGLAHRLSLLLDKIYRKRLKEKVDFILHYGLEKEIYGIPCIRIANGINVREISFSRSQAQPDTLRLIALANWSYWHGLDRLIKGLANYHSGEKIKTVTLTVIGQGNALPEYKRLVSRYGLEEIVQFYPPASGEILDRYFEAADMGIGTLGIFRKGVAIDSSLKHREYCARGIPFVLSSRDLSFSKELPFVYYAEEGEEPIDILALWKFWDKLHTGGKDFRKEIRAYAEGALAWEQQMNFLDVDQG